MTVNGVGKCRQVCIAYQMLALNCSTLHLNFEVFHLHLSILCCSLRSYMTRQPLDHISYRPVYIIIISLISLSHEAYPNLLGSWDKKALLLLFLIYHEADLLAG